VKLNIEGIFLSYFPLEMSFMSNVANIFIMLANAVLDSTFLLYLICINKSEYK